MTWTKAQIQELYQTQLQEVSYAVRHSDPPVSGGVSAPNLTVSDLAARRLEQKARVQCRES
jgi:hypothetical protein